ncbi:MAG: pentapeptide repeat-containing protein, partial [Streptosporangiaceae bacterium]
ASREVRPTVTRVITAHLNGTAPVSWCGLNFDFAGAVFDGGDFRGAKFSGGTVGFAGAKFCGTVSFSRAEFSSETVDFAGAEFSGGTVDFSRVASWTQPPDFGSGFDMSHPPAVVMPPTATSPSPNSPMPTALRRLSSRTRVMIRSQPRRTYGVSNCRQAVNGFLTAAQ